MKDSLKYIGIGLATIVVLPFVLLYWLGRGIAYLSRKKG